MKTFKKMNNLQAINTNEFVALAGTTRLQVRSEAKCLTYYSEDQDFSEEVLVGHGMGGEYEIVAPAGYIRFKSSSRVWLNNPARDQTVYPMSEEVFTTLDRPAPMSPEMQAVHRMMRQNEIERETFRQQLGAVQNAVGNNNSGTRSDNSPQDTATETAEVVEDATGSQSAPDKSADQQAEKPADTDNVPV